MDKLEIVEELGGSGVYLKMVIEGRKCKCCRKIMLKKFKYWDSPFPKFVGSNQDAQMRAYGLVYQSKIEVESEPICVECVANDKAYFVCYLCNGKQSSNEIKETIGSSSPDCLCNSCYAETPAKKWDEIKRELEKEHQYDNM